MFGLNLSVRLSILSTLKKWQAMLYTGIAEVDKSCPKYRLLSLLIGIENVKFSMVAVTVFSMENAGNGVSEKYKHNPP